MKTYDAKSGIKVGDEIRITQMEGEPQYTGKTGKVEIIDDMGQVHGTWGGLALQPDHDRYEVIRKGGVNA